MLRRPGGYEVSSLGRVRRPAFEAPRRRGGTQHYGAFVLKAYLRNGFVTVESVTNDIGSGFVMDDFVMQKTL